MSRLDTIMQTIGMPALRRNLGDAAVYTPAFAPPAEPQPVTTWAILNRSSAPVGEFGERMENRLTAQLPKTDVPDPQPGDSLTVGGKTYRIDQTVNDDGLFVKVAIR